MVLTSILSVQSSLDQVIKLENKRPGLGEERHKARDVLEVGPYDPVSARRFRSRRAPDCSDKVY